MYKNVKVPMDENFENVENKIKHINDNSDFCFKYNIIIESIIYTALCNNENKFINIFLYNKK